LVDSIAAKVGGPRESAAILVYAIPDCLIREESEGYLAASKHLSSRRIFLTFSPDNDVSVIAFIISMKEYLRPWKPARCMRTGAIPICQDALQQRHPVQESPALNIFIQSQLLSVWHGWLYAFLPFLLRTSYISYRWCSDKFHLPIITTTYRGQQSHSAPTSLCIQLIRHTPLHSPIQVVPPHD